MTIGMIIAVREGFAEVKCNLLRVSGDSSMAYCSSVYRMSHGCNFDKLIRRKQAENLIDHYFSNISLNKSFSIMHL